MRLSTVLTTALSGSALVLLTACGGSSDEAAAPSSSSSAAATSSSAASTTEATADADTTAFCDEASTVFSDLESAATGASATDPSGLRDLFAEASSRLSAIEPPAEISESWTTLTGVLQGAVDQTEGVDLTTPEGQQAFLEAFQVLEQQGSQAQTEVQTYLTDTCGLGATPTA